MDFQPNALGHAAAEPPTRLHVMCQKLKPVSTRSLFCFSSSVGKTACAPEMGVGRHRVGCLLRMTAPGGTVDHPDAEPRQLLVVDCKVKPVKAFAGQVK